MKFVNFLIKKWLFMVAVLSPAAAEGIPAGLDGATGNIFKFDVDSRTFELLKETEYDPKTDIGKSRFTVHWKDVVEIMRIEEVKNFDGIKGPVVAKFYGIERSQRDAMKEGRAFETRVAEIYSGAAEEDVTGVSPDHNELVGWFTPDGGEDVRSGVIMVNGREVPVSLRARNRRIFHHQPLEPGDLAKGFWKATLHGSERAGDFVVGQMIVSALPDPRASDDPGLPRVLVIGDSISMNYHEAAKTALNGVANYHRNEGNSLSSVHGVRNAGLWLGNYKEKGFHWDVVQFNHGLHDLKQAYDETSHTFGSYAVPLREYQENLEKEIAILKDTGAQLVWCTTTPVPNDIKSRYARRKGAAKIFNDAALEVMKRHPEIIINDLHAIVSESSVFGAWWTTTDPHFYKAEEQKALGNAVAAAVKKALDKRSE